MTETPTTTTTTTEIDPVKRDVALSALPTAVEVYESTLARKAELEQMVEDCKASIKEQADRLCQLISDAGMQNYGYNGYTYTPGTIHKYYLLSDADCIEKGIEDRFAPFEEDDALCGLVKKDINWRSMQTSLRELEETEDGIPEAVLDVLNITDEFGITRRKASTTNKDKVAQALAKRRKK